jgi:hypothetical protein
MSTVGNRKLDPQIDFLSIEFSLKQKLIPKKPQTRLAIIIEIGEQTVKKNIKDNSTRNKKWAGKCFFFVGTLFKKKYINLIFISFKYTF